MVVDEAVESTGPLRQAKVGKTMFARARQGQFVIGVELMIDAEVDLVAVGKVSFTPPGEGIRSVPPADPLIARCIQTINAIGCLEVVRQRHRVEDRPFDQATLVGPRAQWIPVKYAEGHQITGRSRRPDGVSRQVHTGNGCRRAGVWDSREISENPLPCRRR